MCRVTSSEGRDMRQPDGTHDNQGVIQGQGPAYTGPGACIYRARDLDIQWYLLFLGKARPRRPLLMTSALHTHHE